MTSSALQERARELGVLTTYRDVDDVEHTTPDAVLTPIVEALAEDRARRPRPVVPPVHLDHRRPVAVDSSVTDATLVVDGNDVVVTVPHRGRRDRIELPPDLPVGFHELRVATGSGDGRCTVVVAPAHMPDAPGLAGCGSLFVPTYALWERSAPLPSFGLLAACAAEMHRRGVALISTLPLYATFLDDPFDPSPYSPISRLHWNECYLDDASLPDLDSSRSGGSIGADDELVDWRSLAARRRQQLAAAVRAADRATHAMVDRFVASRPDVAAYGRFRAERSRGSADADDARVHEFSQYLAHEQLLGLHADDGVGRAAIALDLPIGSHPAGYETWAHPGMFAEGMSVGAPPDTFFTAGQNWGFPPQLPGTMEASGFALWRQLIARAGEHADVLRVDHAMAVERLWWIPDGFAADQGAYVRYPREALLTVIATAAAIASVAIVAENLGTVSPEVSAALQRWKVLGMYEEQFHVDDPALPVIPRRSVAGLRTHDMVPFAAFARDRDLTGYRRRLTAALGVDVPADAGHLLEAALQRLARSDAHIVSADIDDLIGEERPHNVPGRTDPGLWSRRLPQPISELAARDDVRRRLTILGRTRT